MEGVARQYGGVVIDLIQCHLHTWNSSTGAEASSERLHQAEVEVFASISCILVWVDLQVRSAPTAEWQADQRDCSYDKYGTTSHGVYDQHAR